MSSLQERVAARRRQREQERTFVLPVIGYEADGLYARYRVLGYEDLHDVGKRNEGLEGTAEGELAVFADTLARACVGLLEKQPDGSFKELGGGWSAYAVRENLGIDLPDGATARDALFAVFNGPTGGTDLARQFKAYDEAYEAPANEIADDIAGESAPSQEGSST